MIITSHGSLAKSGNELYALDAATGSILWDFGVGSSVNAAPAVVDGSVYWGTGYSRAAEGSGNNKLFAFSIGGVVDSTPPSTAIALSPASPNGSNGWYRSAVGVSVSATDNPGGVGVFEGLPEEFLVGRYHSLFARRETFPACLEVTAETEDGVIMGVRHRDLPVEAVQFHPESILTAEGDHGLKLMQNAVRLGKTARV